MGEFTHTVQKDYGVQKKANNYEKSSGNNILEWIWRTKIANN
jgi:hypothetical protein